MINIKIKVLPVICFMAAIIYGCDEVFPEAPAENELLVVEVVIQVMVKAILLRLLQGLARLLPAKARIFLRVLPSFKTGLYQVLSQKNYLWGHLL